MSHSSLDCRNKTGQCECGSGERNLSGRLSASSEVGIAPRERCVSALIGVFIVIIGCNDVFQDCIILVGEKTADAST